MDAYTAYKKFIFARDNRETGNFDDMEDTIEAGFDYLNMDTTEISKKPSEVEVLLKKAFDLDTHNLSIINEINNRSRNYFLSDEFVISSLKHFLIHFPFHKVLDNNPYDLIRGKLMLPVPYKDFLKEINDDPEIDKQAFDELYKIQGLDMYYKNILQTLLDLGESDSVIDSLTETCGLSSFDLVFLGFHIGKSNVAEITTEIEDEYVEKGLADSWFLSSYPVDIKASFLKKAVQIENAGHTQANEILNSNEKDAVVIKEIYDSFKECGEPISLLYRLIFLISKNAFSLPEEELYYKSSRADVLSLFIRKTFFLPPVLKYFFSGGKKKYDKLNTYCAFELESLRLEKMGALHLFAYALLSPVHTGDDCGDAALCRCVLTSACGNCIAKRTLSSSPQAHKSRKFLQDRPDSGDKERQCAFDALCEKTKLGIREKLGLLLRAYKIDKKNIHIIFNVLRMWVEHPLNIYVRDILDICGQVLTKIDFKKPVDDPRFFIDDTLSGEEVNRFTAFTKDELNKEIIGDCLDDELEILDKESILELPGKLSLFTLVLKTYERAGEFQTLTDLIGEYFFLSHPDYMYLYNVTAQNRLSRFKYRSIMKTEFRDYYDPCYADKERLYKYLYSKEYSEEEADCLTHPDTREYLKLLENRFEKSDIPMKELLLSFEMLSYALCRDSDRNMDNSEDFFREIDKVYYEKTKDDIDDFQKKYGTSILSHALYTACYMMLLPESLEQAYDEAEKLIKSCYYFHYSYKRSGIGFPMVLKVYSQLKAMKENRDIFESLYSGSSFIAFYGKNEYLPIKETVERKDFYITQTSLNKFSGGQDSYKLRYEDILTGEGCALFDKIQRIQELIPINLAAVTSEKKVYRPGERPVLCFIFPGKINKDFAFTIFSKAKESIVTRRSLTTDEWGTAVYGFEYPPDPDTYKVTIDSLRETGYEFRVADYSYSPLFITIEKEENKPGGDEVFLHITAELFSIPYNGELKFDYTADYFINKEEEVYIEIKDGRGIVKIPAGFWRTLTFITPDGYTARIKKEEENYGWSKSIHCITYGFNFSDTYGKPFWGLHLGWDTSREFKTYDKYVAFEIEGLFENENIIIRFRKNIKYGRVAVVDEKNRISFSKEFADKKADSVITLPGSDLFSILEIGGICDDDNIFYERRALVLFMPPELSVSVPEKAGTGEEVEVVIKTTKKCRVLLSVTDSRVEKEYCDTRLGKQLTEYLCGYEYDCNRIENYLGTCIRDMDPLSALFSDYDMVYEDRRRRRGIVREDISREFGEKESWDPDGDSEGIRERRDFRDILFFDFVDVDKEGVVKIKLNDRITTWDIHLTAVYRHTIASAHAQLPVSNDFFVELDLPAFISAGDSVVTNAFVKLLSGEQALLRIKTPGKEYSDNVTETGSREIILTGPGTIEAELTCGDKKDRIVRELPGPGRMTVSTEKLTYLHAGDTMEAEKDGDIDIYENEIYFAEKVIQALIRYPFGCSEQTASKLKGLAYARKAIAGGFTGFHKDEIDVLITYELDRLTRFIAGNNLFSFWEKGTPSEFVTEKVIINLLPFLEMGYEEAVTPIERAKRVLLKRQYKSNSLMRLDKTFKKYNDIKCVDDACEFYFAEDNRVIKEKCIEYLINNAHISNGGAFWKGSFYWGGTAEATAKACKVLFDSENDDLFTKGFTFLSSKLKESRLYSTSDTSALIDLFMYMYERKKQPVAVIDGKECMIKGRMTGKKITVQSGTVLVSNKKREEVNVLDLQANNLDFDISISKINLEIADKLVLSVSVKEDIKCPVVSIYLPPVLCSLSHGVQIQTIVAPVTWKTIAFELTGIKKGSGQLYILVYDMYEEEKRGCYSGRVDVRERTRGFHFSGNDEGALGLI